MKPSLPMSPKNTPPKSTCCEKCKGGEWGGTDICVNKKCPCHTQSTELEKIVEEFWELTEKHSLTEKGIATGWMFDWMRAKFPAYAQTKVDEALEEGRHIGYSEVLVMIEMIEQHPELTKERALEMLRKNFTLNPTTK